MNIIILMAGAGSRFIKAGQVTPKPLIKVLNKTLIEHSIDSFNVDGRFIFITRTFDDPEDNLQLSEILKRKRPESVEIKLDKLTKGAAESALYAKDLIDNNDPLVIYNCDQIINWNSNDFVNFTKNKNPDAALVLYDSEDPKNSFAEIKNKKIVRLAEKKVISNHALIGFHYWKNGSDFVASAERRLSKFQPEGKAECFISETFNYLEGKTIFPYHIANSNFIPLGTPEDVAKYIGIVQEFKTTKAKTLFIDIDGTILKHQHTISDVHKYPPKILPGVVEKINSWDSKGHKIIFVTARKESTRQITEDQLREFGLAWDQLIMGVSNGQRYLINDKLEVNDPNRAIAFNVITDEGFNSINWGEHDL